MQVKTILTVIGVAEIATRQIATGHASAETLTPVLLALLNIAKDSVETTTAAEDAASLIRQFVISPDMDNSHALLGWLHAHGPRLLPTLPPVTFPRIVPA